MSAGVASAGRLIDGRFTLEALIGSGGGGQVWSARDGADGTVVAVKLLHSTALVRPEVIARFAREAEILLALRHPAIARAIAFRLEPPPAYVAMELVDGTRLDRAIGEHTLRGEHFTLAEVLAIVRTASSALEHAHAHGVVHRDLKPQNMITTPGGLRILDFGLAKLLGTDASDETTRGRRLGSLFYMAPEQARGGEIDVRTDVFALATITFELLTLKRAWAAGAGGRLLDAFGDTQPDRSHNATFQVMERIARAPRPSAREHRPELPEAAERALHRALASDRAARPPTPGAFLADLEAALAESAPTVHAARDDLERITIPDSAGASPPREEADPSGGADGPTTELEPTPILARAAADTLLESAPTVTKPRARRPGFDVVALVAVACVAAAAAIYLEARDRAEPTPVSEATAGADPAPPAARTSEPERGASDTVGGAPPSTHAVATPTTSGVPEPRGTSSARTSASPPRESSPSRGAGSEARRGPRASASRTADPADAATPGRSAELRRMLAATEADPSDVRAIARLADAIERAASELPDASTRARVQRIARSSGMVGDVAGLALALRELEKAERNRP